MIYCRRGYCGGHAFFRNGYKCPGRTKTVLVFEYRKSPEEASERRKPSAAAVKTVKTTAENCWRGNGIFFFAAFSSLLGGVGEGAGKPNARTEKQMFFFFARDVWRKALARRQPARKGQERRGRV